MPHGVLPRYSGRVRGFVAYHLQEPSERASRRPPAAFIDEIVVARRGRGLGTRLLSYFSGRRVELRVHFNNKRGAALYAKFGFERCMGDTGVAPVFRYPDTHGYRCKLCRTLPARLGAAAEDELTHYDSWRQMPLRVRNDIRALTHRAHRSYTEARVRRILHPPASEGPPCRFVVALADEG